MVTVCRSIPENTAKQTHCGTATKAIGALYDLSAGDKLEISNIVQSAHDFWAKLGIGVQNHGEGAAYDATLTRKTFLASVSGTHTRGARSSIGSNNQTSNGSIGQASVYGSEHEEISYPSGDDVSFKRKKAGSASATNHAKAIADAVQSTVNVPIDVYESPQDAIKEEFNVELSATKASGADYLFNFKDADQLRTRAVTERIENDRRASIKSVRPEDEVAFSRSESAFTLRSKNLSQCCV